MYRGMEDDRMFSLDEEERLLAYAINNDAAMIYFHHGAQQFVYFIGADRAKYREEMSNLNRGIHQRRISAITAGEAINVKGTDLFPMDVLCLAFDRDSRFSERVIFIFRAGRMSARSISPPSASIKE